MNKKKFEQEVTKFKKPTQPDLITSIPKPNLINDLPSFDANPLMDRMKLLDINKLDPHGISKKITVKKADIDLSQELEDS